MCTEVKPLLHSPGGQTSIHGVHRSRSRGVALANDVPDQPSERCDESSELRYYRGMTRWALVSILACSACGDHAAHGSDAATGDGARTDTASPDGASGGLLVHVSSNKRYLVDSSDHPFYLVG